MWSRHSVRVLLAAVVLGLAGAGWQYLAPPGSPPPFVRSVGAAIRVADLPAEAREVLRQIRNGGPFRYAKDGSVFGNREGLLPARARGYYTEYTVPTPGAGDRGARRIIAGAVTSGADEFYYTDDHYRSFRRIRE